VPYEEEQSVFLGYCKFAKKKFKTKKRKKRKKKRRVMASSGLLVAVFLFQARIQCPFLFVLILCLSLMGGFLFESVPSCFRLLFIFIYFYNFYK
jgi:hypothetical protein